MSRKPLGELLIERGSVKRPQVELALTLQRGSGRRLGSLLVEMSVVRELDVLEALADQHGVPAVDLNYAQVRSADLTFVSESIAKKNLILPFRVLEDRIQVAMANPSTAEDQALLPRLEGRPVDIHIALESQLRTAIDSAYKARRVGEAEWIAPTSGRAGAGVSQVDFEAIRFEDGRWTGEFIRPTPAALAPALRSSVALPAVKPAPVRTPTAVTNRRASSATSTPKPASSTSSRTPRVAAAKSAPSAPAPRSEDSDIFSVVNTRAPSEDSVSGIVIETLDSSSAARTLESLSQSETTHTIVLADADAESRRATAAMLRTQPFRVLEASDGGQTLEYARGGSVDAIVMDPSMPGLHGLDVCKQLRVDGATARIPIVVLSAQWRGWRVQTDLRDVFGVSAFLEKPCAPAKLFRTMQNVLSLSAPENGAPARAAIAVQKEAVVEQKAGRVGSALEKLRRAVSLDPFSASLRSQLAAMLLRVGSTFEAMQELEEAAEMDPQSLTVLRSLAMLYEKRGFKRKAAEAWERALRVAGEGDREEIRKKLGALL